MNLDYKQKYLKYKNKYLFTKSLKGGVLTQQSVANILIQNFTKPPILPVDDLINRILTFYKNNELFITKIRALYTYYLKTTYPLPALFYTNIESFINQIVPDLMSSEISLRYFEQRALEIK